jgi:metal-responsive CopG/Arc/MetJ family transcriptional regulator
MASRSEQETEQINVRVTKSFLKDIDEVWQGRGYNSRSEFIRHVLHDAVENPTFDRDELLALALTERELREEQE